ncbi:tetratricopeptide repeat protein [Candidatus Peregrinibacteria bacterium]|nr:tetratricopeptide repeat protein [Candidatus Peregrinibacteria bacterium]
MVQLYLFLAALVAIPVIVTRRYGIHKKEEKARFKKKIDERVQELKKTAHEDTLRRFKEEYKKFQKRKRIDPTEYNILVKKAEMAISKKQWITAKQILIQAIAMAKNEIVAGLKLASVYQQCNELNKAENLYRRLLEAHPNYADIYSNLGQIFTQKKKYKEAITTYARAVDLDEKNDQNLIALGKLYVILRHYDSAIECFKRATLLKPREVYYLLLLGKTYEENEEDQNALFTYEKILTVEPYNERAKEFAQDLRIKLNSLAAGH